MDRCEILIADDAEVNRHLLRLIFAEQYEVIEARDGEETLEMIEMHRDKLAVIFLDLVMPKASGLDVLKFMSLKGYIDIIPVIMITGESTDESDEKAYEYGASDIIYKPFAPKVVMRRTKNIVELFESRRNIEKELESRTRELFASKEALKRNSDFLINALSSVVEFRSLESGEHIERVQRFTKILTKYIMVNYPEYGITKEKAKLIVSASALHDIGKIAIPDNILLKPGKLTPEEFEEMKKHTTFGCEILERFRQNDNDFYRYCYDICRYHHERYDGKGYPDNLVGDDIPIWAQIVSIVDVYDALVSPRVYKTPFAFNEAIRMIYEGECGVFSPKILDCFDWAKEEFQELTLKELSFVGNNTVE